MIRFISPPWENGIRVGYCRTIALQWYYMRDKHYKNKSIRISDENWEKLKTLKGVKSWNLLITEMLSTILKRK